MWSWWNLGTRNYRYEFLELPRRWPAVCRIYYMHSFASVPDPANPANLKAAMVLNPVVVLWNPYNLELTIPNHILINSPQETTPIKFSFTIGGKTYPPVSLNAITASNNSDLISRRHLGRRACHAAG